MPALLQCMLPMLRMVKSDHMGVESNEGAKVEVVSKGLHIGKHLAAARQQGDSLGHQGIGVHQDTVSRACQPSS